MKYSVFLGCVVSHVAASILFPAELTSVLGFLYPWVPPAKIGTDSRLGFGFRLGQNADAQFLLELGPQSNTLSLGDTNRKRDVTQKNFESAFTGKWKNIFAKRYKYNIVTRIPSRTGIRTTPSTSKITTTMTDSLKQEDITAARTPITSDFSATHSIVNTTLSSRPSSNIPAAKETPIAYGDGQNKTPIGSVDLPVYLSDKFLVSDRYSVNASATNSLELIKKYKQIYPVFSVNVFKLVHSLMRILPDSKT